MTIIWYGHSCFKITDQGGHLSIITDPFSKEIGLNPPRGSADIVTISHDHFDHNNAKTISGNPFVINSPGEYEIRQVRITGYLSFHDSKKGQERGQNTIFLIEMDKIRICHLGDFGQEKLSDKDLEAIGRVDVLMAPVGGVYTIDARKAAEIVNQIEPKIVIPMHYKLPGLKKVEGLANVADFLEEMGVEKKPAVNKLVIKRKDLTGENVKVVVMKP